VPIQTTEGSSSLSQSPILRYFTFIVLYFSQGIPEGITIFAIPAWLAMNGKSVSEIAGYSAIIMIPFSLKIVLAPIMERYTYLPMGRRRPWLLFGQLGIFGSLISLACLRDPLEHIFELSILAACVHVFIIFQDIATDSLVIDIVPIDEQGKANSFMWGSKTIGTSLTLIIGTLLLNKYGLFGAIVPISTFILLIMLVPLTVRERQGEKLLPWSKGETSPETSKMAIDSWLRLWKSFKQVLILPNTLLMVLAIFITMAAIHYMRTLLPIFTIQELHWTNLAYGSIYSTFNLVGGIVGMIVGGLLIQRIGVVRFIQISLLLMSLLGILVSVSSALWSNPFIIQSFVAVFCALVTFITIGSLALAMQLCWKRISALQFTFCMTAFNLGLSAGAAFFGYIRSYFEWQSIFLLFSVMIIVSMATIYFIKTKKHAAQIEKLELEYQEKLKESSPYSQEPEVLSSYHRD
jgi:PAT family beta-lactamase induction signal transducer AmpG